MVLKTFEAHYLTVTASEGAVFHYPELPVGTIVQGVERARRVARLLDSNNFIFKELTVVPGTNGGSQLTRKGRYLHPAILETTYRMFIRGHAPGTINELATMRYAGPTYMQPGPDGDDDADSEWATLWENGLQGPNTNKRIIDEVPRTALGFVAACIAWVLRQYDIRGNLPPKLPNMTLDDNFTNEVTWLVRKSTGMDMAMITREVKACGKVVAGQESSNVADRDDGGDILSD
jgi:hypothetical protein